MTRSDPRQSGFSITELLLYMALATVVVAAAASSVITSIRTASTLELRQRAVDQFGRVNYFLQSEVAEGEEISYGTPTLPAACGSGQSLFTITVPFLINGTPANPPAFIHYYTRNSGSELWRCGPMINAQGVLMLSGTQGVATTLFAARVVNRTVFTLLGTNDRQAISYSIQFLSPKGQVTLQRGNAQAPLVARTGVRLIE